jgi:hypothetical protein
MMKATMTDVQRAIEQLGSERDGDGKSFSFRSKDADTDTDMTDAEAEGNGDWHKGARSRLANAVASRVGQNAESSHGGRSVQPPIEVELSDESEDDMEDEDTQPIRTYSRDHPRINEEDEGDDEQSPDLSRLVNRLSNNTLVDQRTEESEEGIRTARPNDGPFPFPSSSQSLRETQTSNSMASLPTPVSSGRRSSSFGEERTTIRPLPTAPTPTAAISSAAHNLPSPQTSKHSSVASASNAGESSTSNEKKASSPSEWTVEEVVDWLKGKGFDSDVCDKFTGMLHHMAVSILFPSKAFHRARNLRRHSSRTRRQPPQK